MALELSSNHELLMANQFGKFVAQNLALSTFKRSKEDWRKVLESKSKKTELAKDFLSDILQSPDDKKGPKVAKKRPKTVGNF